MSSDAGEAKQKQDIGEITNTLLRNHAAARAAKVVENLIQKLKNDGVMDDPFAIVETNLVRALFHILLDKHFCGYSKEVLTSLLVQDRLHFRQHMLPYFFSILILTQVCVDAHIWEAEGRGVLPTTTSPKLWTAVAFLQDQLRRLWEALWDIKTPFLDSTLTKDGTLYLPLAELGRRQLELDSLRPPPSEKPAMLSHLPHVQLALWIYADKADIRLNAASTAMTVLKGQYELQNAINEGYSMFRKEAMMGGIKAEEVAKALLKDLRDDGCLDVRLNHTLAILNVYSNPGQHTIIQDAPSYTRPLLASALAACRREICNAGGQEGETLRGNLGVAALYMLYLIPDYTHNLGRLPESCAHAIIPFVCDYVVRLVREDVMQSRPTCFTLTELLGQCRTIIKSHSEHLRPAGASPKLSMLRRCSHKSLEHAALKIRAHGQKVHSQWKVIMRLLDTLGKYLEHLEDNSDAKDKDVNPYTPLERCHRPECFCSVHKRSHRLRVCEGCWRVAYCNTYCQSETGRHTPRLVGVGPLRGELSARQCHGI